jgi:CheY-like chemotaxis protein
MASHKKKLRVLVVDDDLDTVHSTAVLLRDGGCEVDFAINGIAALFVAQRWLSLRQEIGHAFFV